MKENGKLQLEILLKKKEHIQQNIKNLEEKSKNLVKQKIIEEKALKRVENTIENFGKPKDSVVSNHLKDNSTNSFETRRLNSFSGINTF